MIDNSNNTDPISNLTGVFEKLVETLTETNKNLSDLYSMQSHAKDNQYPKIFGSAFDSDGRSYRGGRSSRNLSDRDIIHMMEYGGRNIKDARIQALFKKFDSSQEKISKKSKERSKLLKQQDKLKNKIDEAREKGESTEALKRQYDEMEEQLKNINSELQKTGDAFEEVREQLHEVALANKDAVQRASKVEDRRRSYEDFKANHNVKWYRDFNAYNKQQDTLEATQRWRNDIQMAQNTFSKTGLGGLAHGKVGNFVNGAFDAINQGLNTYDSIKQIQSMFGRGGGGGGVGNGGRGFFGRISGNGTFGGGTSVASAGEMAEAAEGAASAMEGASAAAEGAAGAMEGAGAAAGAAEGGMAAAGAGASAAGAAGGGAAAGLTGAAAALGPFAVALIAAVVAVKAFTAVVNASMERTRKDLEAQGKLAQMAADYQVSDQEQIRDKLLEIRQAEADIEVNKAKTESQKSIAEAQVTAAKSGMQAQLQAATMTQQAKIGAGFLANGINDTAWDALKAKVELGTMARGQDIEKQKLETQLRATKEQLSTQQDLFAATRQLEQDTRLSQIESERKALRANYDADRLVEGATAKLEHQADYAGRFAQTISWTNGNRTAAAENFGDNGRQIGREYANMFDYQNNPMYDRMVKENGGDIAEHNAGDAIYDFMGVDVVELRKQQIANSMIGAKFDTAVNKITELTEAQIHQIGKKQEYDVSGIVADTKKQLIDIQSDAVANIEKTWNDAGKDVKMAWIEMARQLEKSVMDYEAQTNDYGISQGFTDKGQLLAMQERILKDVRDYSSMFGVKQEDYLDMRSGYNEATGRNAQISEHDAKQMSSLYKMMGHDTGFVAEYGGAMEIFNQGIDESVNRLDKAMQSVNKIGLNGRKFAKEVVQNLKMAQRYNFKDGTQGLMRMTEWAMKTRFNMQSLGGIIDKILDGGLEGVIEQSSRLQVLGGNAAIYSDPFSMLYNAGVDPEALGKQFQNMTKGMGSINRQTGETEFNWSEVAMLREIAKNQGRDVGDIMDEVRARNRRESVQLAMSADQKSRFTQDQLDYMGNLATYNKEKGAFTIKVYNDKGEFKETAIDKIRPEDIEKLQPVEHEAKMEDYMQRILSGVETIAASEIKTGADAAVSTFVDMLANMEQRAENAYNEYLKNRETLLSTAMENWKKATAETTDFLTNSVNATNDMANITNRAVGSISAFTIAIEEATARINSHKGDSGVYGPAVSNGMLTDPVDKADGANSNVNDVYVSGNGRSFGGTASQIIPLNDGFIANPADEGLIGKKGGWVDKLVNGMYSMLSSMYNGGSSNINISGSLRLESNGQSLDIIKMIENDPMAQRYLSGMLLRQVTINNLGGKANNPINNGNRNAFV